MNWSLEEHSDDFKAQQALKNIGRIPRHVAIIMDGNGRWANGRSLPRAAGHKEGINSVRDIVKACSQLGVTHLTLYAFSMENWRRPSTEVTILMELLHYYLGAETEELHANNVRLNVIGKVNALPKKVQQRLHESMERMHDNTGLTLTLALSYSGRWDVTRAVQMIALDARRGKLSPEDITEETLSQYLQTNGTPDPDVIIRTSGELRLSNFLLWESAYSEIYVTDIFWPDFRREQFYEALHDYARRERRFGKTSQQLAEEPPQESYVQRFINAFKSAK